MFILKKSSDCKTMTKKYYLSIFCLIIDKITYYSYTLLIFTSIKNRKIANKLFLCELYRKRDDFLMFSI